MGKAWRLILDEAGDAGWNMAVDEAMLEAAIAGEQPPTVRFYYWKAPSISLGRSQKPEKVLDVRLCRERGIRVARRLTGGKAVLHGHDVTLCIVAPLPLFSPARRVIEVHLRIVQALARGFRRLGIEARPVVHTDARALRGFHANCFARALPGDLIGEGGVKLVGGAQYRRREVVMEQVSIPVHMLPNVLRDTLQPWEEPPQPPLLGIDEHRLIEALLEGLTDELHICGDMGTLSETEARRARQLQPGYEVLGAL